VNIFFLELHQKISVFIENNLNIKECNENYFTYPQKLYILLLQRKNVNIEFIKFFEINIERFN
jgi:uncharacterized membrane protein